MARIARQNIMASYGDQGVFTSGQAVFNTDGTTNVKPGQLVVWNPVTQLSIGAGATITSNDRIVVSVGVDKKTLRSSFGEEIYGNYIQAVTAEPPACGLVPVWDILWNDVNCDEDFTLNIAVSNNDTQNTYPYNKPAVYTYTVKAGTCACSSCDNGIDGHALACALRDAINAERSSLTKLSTFLPSKLSNKSKGFSASILYGGDNPDTATNATTYQYCINPVVDDTCGISCINGDVSITSISFTLPGDESPTTFEISSTVIDGGEGDDGGILSELENIVTQINEALDGNGSAVIVRGVGSCCPYKLEVNTCFNDFVMADENADLTPCETFNPFDTDDFPITLEHSCKNCDSAPTRTFKRGIRIFGEAIDFSCDSCTPDLNPVWMKVPEISVFPVSGFGCSQSYVRNTQVAVLPENLGYDWVVRDYMTDNGGAGRGQDNYEWRGYGAAGYPLSRGRSGGLKNVKCAHTYCSYAISHSLPHTDPGVKGYNHATRGLTVVLIPSVDTTTRTEFEAILNPYAVSSLFPKKVSVTCGSDQDQVETVGETVRYPDSNGYIL